MPNSYVSNYVHVVFSTRNRIKNLDEKFQPRLWAYMAGIISSHGMHAVTIGGMEDHIHALLNLGASFSIAKAVQVLKANSSRWINEHERPRFEWQEGYFGCSVSRSQIAVVSKYIKNQREHHKKRDFAAELALLLKKHGIQPLG